MSESVKSSLSEHQCPACGTVLPGRLGSEFCPKCLLGAGLATQPEVGPEGTVVVSRSVKSSKGLPQPGEQFGHYQMVRLLGQGGMGVVYEAEDLESGRRVALKILGQALDSPEARKRFLREGQLAASINHPNSVYVFGTEEIGGTPVIAMELMPGGTLHDRIVRGGPMTVSEAVNITLQIVTGLEAAQQIGILHRDIKPSNCFINHDGTVKIGDFGLSISSAVRTESNLTETGVMFGTPAFSSPEQLRGDELTVRSDIYSVGVTLYQLLTGRMPFEAGNVVQLLATVLEGRAESPAKWRAELPAGLCRAILRCLEKDAGERFASYGKLREALLPYASTAQTPATLGLRFLAGCLDTTLLAPVSFQIAQILQNHGWVLVSTLVFWGIILTYYGLLEGIWSATLGKAIFGLRTVNRAGNPPGLLRASLRALVFAGISMFGVDVVGAMVEGHVSNNFLQGLLAITVWFALLGLTFMTARRRNGFGGLHDLASRTRVIVKSAHSARPASALQVEPVGNTEALLQLGPYYLLEQLGEVDDAEMLLGYDARLLRKVWIRKLPIGSPPVTAELRNLARPGRLRWLNGKRSATEAWDAYEAVPGKPLLSLISAKQSWHSVRFWLLDLAGELQAVQASGVGVSLRLDQIWITNDGHAKLLDFSMPGAARASTALNANTTGSQLAANEFLYEVAVSALQGCESGSSETSGAFNVPVALHARKLIQVLKAASTPAEVANQLNLLLRKPAVVSRARRLALLAGGVWFPVLLTVFIMLSGTEKSVVWQNRPFGYWGLAWVYAMTVVVIPCVLAALMFRGGALLRGLGLVVVNADGSEASRAKVFYRNFLAWLPLVITPLLAWLLGLLIGAAGAALTLFSLLLVLSLKFSILPERSLQDRVAGTYLVPR